MCFSGDRGFAKGECDQTSSEIFVPEMAFTSTISQEWPFRSFQYFTPRKQTIPWRYQWTEVILHEVSDRSHNLVPIERGVTTGQIAIEVPCFAPTQSHIANSETRFCWLCEFNYAIISSTMLHHASDGMMG